MGRATRKTTSERVIRPSIAKVGQANLDRGKVAKRKRKALEFRKKLSLQKSETESALSVLSLSHALSDGTSSIGDADHKRNNIKILNKVSSNRRKKKILHEEREQFSAVLEHEAFKSGGLATIREHLQNTIARGKNAV